MLQHGTDREVVGEEAARHTDRARELLQGGDAEPRHGDGDMCVGGDGGRGEEKRNWPVVVELARCGWCAMCVDELFCSQQRGRGRSVVFCRTVFPLVPS